MGNEVDVWGKRQRDRVYCKEARTQPEKQRTPLVLVEELDRIISCLKMFLFCIIYDFAPSSTSLHISGRRDYF